MRFLHTSDWQLGMRRHYLDAEAGARFAAERFDAVRRLGEVGRKAGCDFAVVAGDVFESNRVAGEVVLKAIDAMAAADLPWYLLPGNHDPLDGASVYRSPELAAGRRPSNIHLLTDFEPRRVTEGVEVVGAPWRSKRPGRDLVAELAASLSPARGLRVAVAHGRVDTFTPQDRDPAIIRRQGVDDAVERGLFHYLALGDRHSATRLGDRVYYSGAPEATDFKEQRPGRGLVVAVDAEGSRVEEVAVGRWTFRTDEARLAGEDDVAELENSLEDIADKTRAILRLTLVGELSLRARALLDDTLERVRGRFAHLEADSSDLVLVPSRLDEEDLSLAGYGREAFRALQQAAGDPSSGDRPGERQAASDALSLLYRLAGGGVDA
ncbi:MAG: metallophosphoesterase [Acidobacteriota bacterium]